MNENSSKASRLGAHDALADIAATEAGFAAAEAALFAGVSVNLTGVCSPRQVSAARAAHRRALARRLEAHLPVQRIACVASMPLAAIDRAADSLLPPSAAALRGCAAFGAAPLALRWIDATAAQAVLAQLARHGIELDTIGNDMSRPDLTLFGHGEELLLALPV